MASKVLRNRDMRNFEATLQNCGFDTVSIEYLLHSVSWNKKLTPDNDTIKKISLRYFENPPVFLAILQHGWEFDKVFPDFMRIVMYSVPKRADYDNQVQDNIQPVINSLMRERESTLPEAVRNIAVTEEQTDDLSRKWNQARATLFGQISNYKYAVASWPLHEDPTLFNEYRDWLKNVLLIKEASETEKIWIDLYNSFESRLASLTNFNQRGNGLIPLTLSMGTVESKNDDNKNADMEEYKKELSKAKEKYLDAQELVDLAQKSIENIKKNEKLDIDKETSQAAIEAIREKAKKQIEAEGLQALIQSRDEKYNDFNLKIYSEPWDDWPIDYQMPRNDGGVIDRWYAWASQFWLSTLHMEWFRSMSKMSRSSEAILMLQATQIVVIDDASSGASRFMKYGLGSVNIPQLIYVYVLRNKSPWWRTPELQWEDCITDAEIDVEPIEYEEDRSKTIQSRLLNIKESLDEGLMVQNGNVVLYTTSPELIAFCLYRNIDIFVYNIWCGERPIEIASMREQILRQSALLGASVTPKVPDSTRILTFCALMLISTSSGLPMYVAFGWENVFKQWFGIVKEYQKMVKPDWRKAESTCAWLAREGDEGRIILNQKLIIPLVSRILMSKIAPERPYTKLISSLPTWGKNYDLLREENRIGKGRVEPVAVLNMWTPDTTVLFDSRPALSEDVKRQLIEEEEKERKADALQRYKAELDQWLQMKTLWDEQQINDWEDKRQQALNKIQSIDLPAAEQEQKEWQTKYDKELDSYERNEQALEENREELKKGVKEIEKLEYQKLDLDFKLTAKKKEAKEYDDKLNSTVGFLQSFAYTNPHDEVAQIIIAITDIQSSIDKQKNENENLKRFISKEEIFKTNQSQVLTMLKSQEPKPFDVNDKISQWEGLNPRPDPGTVDYKDFTTPRPEKESLAEYKPNISNNNTIDFLTMDAVKALDDTSWEVDSDDEEESHWWDRREWLYAQRQIFQDNYYAPVNIEDLLLRFRIRFKDWTGAPTVTINN